MFWILTISFTTGLFVSESLFFYGVMLLLTSFMKIARMHTSVREYQV